MKISDEMKSAIRKIDANWHEDLVARAGLTADEALAFCMLVDACKPVPPKLSHAQRRMLEGALAGDPGRGIRGRSAHGGADGTRVSLIRLGLLTQDLKLTIAGHDALRCPECRRVHNPADAFTRCVPR